MIKCEQGRVAFEGNIVEIEAEISTLLQVFYRDVLEKKIGSKKAKEEMDNIYKHSMMDTNVLEEELKGIIKNIIAQDGGADRMMDFMDKFFKTMEVEEDE